VWQGGGGAGRGESKHSGGGGSPSRDGRATADESAVDSDIEEDIGDDSPVKAAPPKGGGGFAAPKAQAKGVAAAPAAARPQAKGSAPVAGASRPRDDEELDEEIAEEEDLDSPPKVHKNRK